jgi:asparagine synthase (glutamine-hydrolysing)
MNGIGFAIYDVEKDEYFAQDHMGIIPLYIGWDEHGTFMWLLVESARRILYKDQLFPQDII